MSEAQFGRMQHRIMQVIWERNRVSAREITEALNLDDEQVAHSTVQTLLRQLEAKRAIGHEAQGRTFVFFPLVEEARVKQGATRDLLDRVFGGKAGDLVAHLLKTERLSKAELDELKRLINQHRKD